MKVNMFDILHVQLALEKHAMSDIFVLYVISKCVCECFFGVEADSLTSSIRVGGSRHHLG